MTSQRFLLVVAFACSVMCSANPAAAQFFKICGDVDDNDTVTVTDGVQVLRAAAGLSSDCTDAICDVDVNGTIGVTDGVIVLRKAAGLSITQNCIPDEGNIDQRLAYLIQFSQPLVLDVLPTIVLHREETVDNDFPCDNGEDGLYSVSTFDGEQTGSFSECYFGNAVIDGDAENANDDPILAITITDARFDDELGLEGRDGTALLSVIVEGGIKYSGRLDASPFFNRFDELSDFLLIVQNLQVDVNGFPKGGSLTYVFDEDSGMTGIRQAQVFYDGSNLARVLVTFDDGSFKNYRFELQFLNFL
jgi:hypothetical protein